MKMTLRKATLNDLPVIVHMLADDILGQFRETISANLDPCYTKAFELITQDPNQDLVVLVDDKDSIQGTLQLTYLQYLNNKGSKRALIESVRIHRDSRGKGLGKIMMELAIERAKNNQVNMVQLTSDERRKDALRFYESIGFIASHTGFKLIL